MSCHAFIHFFSNALTVQTCAKYVSTIFMDPVRSCVSIIFKTSQELRMLSSVTLNCQVTKIVMNSGSQLS